MKNTNSQSNMKKQATGKPHTVLLPHNLKLVVKIAMIYQKVYRNLLDLIQEGNLGLIRLSGTF